MASHTLYCASTSSVLYHDVEFAYRWSDLSLRARAPHLPGQARAVIQLMQAGGPSQMDLFDPKPELQKRGKQSIPLSIEKPPGVGR